MTDPVKDKISRPDTFDFVNAAIAAAVLIFSFIIFDLTKAPSVSFWDCGEFITCAKILGVAHPPGNPLYALISRIFAVLPIAADFAVRVNLVSVVFSALTALFGYLVAVRLLRSWYEDQNSWQNRIIIYIGGFTGSLFMIFANTVWDNGVEAEVYAMAMMMMMAFYWLALRYLECRDSSKAGRLMLMAIYVAMLSVGVHLTAYIVVPVLAFYLIFRKDVGSRQWVLLSMYFIVELLLIMLLSARPDELPVYLPTLVVAVLYLFHALYIGKFEQPIIITLGLFLFASLPFLFYLLSVASGSSQVFLNNVPLASIGQVLLLAWAIYSWYQYLTNRKGKNAIVWMLAGSYGAAPAILAVIGTFAHGYYAFLVLSGLIAIGLAILIWRDINPDILIAVGSVSLIILGFWQFIWGMIIGGIVLALLGAVIRKIGWKIALSIILMSAIAWSVHVFIPIRSAHQPYINENNPSKSLSQFVGYLERKQYGSKTMTERMFARRAEWKNQFGTFQRLGFWGFFAEQYGLTGRKFFIPLLLGLIGMWEAIRRKPGLGLPLLILVLVCTVGLILYMNFADGTRENKVYAMDYMEVRNRDYFFTPGFMLFGLAIGLGIAGVLDIIREAARGLGKKVGNIGFAAASLLVLMPIFPVANNYFYNDRSRNFMAFDYSDNYLKSCRPNAILITNGDNDTFPVWCLQQVYGIRKDVKIVNLSLGNTGWYIRQLRDQRGVPMTFNDAQLEHLRSIVTPSGAVFRIQDQLVDNIIQANRWKYPIQMTFTVPPESRRYQGKTLDSNLTLEGMAFTLVPNADEPDINFELTRKLFMHDFNYRGINDPTIYQNESTVRLLNNYAQGFILLADSLKRAGDIEGCYEILNRGIEVIPEAFDLYAYETQVFADIGKLDTLDTFVEEAPTDRKKELYFNYAAAARYNGRYDEAKSVLVKVLERWPDYSDAYKQLMNLYYQDAQYDMLGNLLHDWLTRHPNDTESQQLVRQLDKIRKADTGAARRAP